MTSPFTTIPPTTVANAGAADRVRREREARDAVRAVLWRARKGLLSVDEARDMLSVLGLLDTAAGMAKKRRGRR